jgi:hypothetical protein
MFELPDIDKIFILLNQVFEAGIAITALSLFFRSLSFNLRNRTTRAFAVILACVMVVFSGEAIASAVASERVLVFWLKFQWFGLLFFPTAYVHFADALLETTGRPSRGRRRTLIRSGYAISTLFLILLAMGRLLGPVVLDSGPFAYLESTSLSLAFVAYYLLAVALATWWMYRAFHRTRVTVSRRRLSYLQVGAVLLALGTFPYLQLGGSIASALPTLFLVVVVVGNIAVFWFLVLMAYSVAFFGVSWPDRIIRSRLLKWMLRGPSVLFVVLLLITATQQIGLRLGQAYSIAIPIVTVTSVLIFEHLITLIYPGVERWLIFAEDRDRLQSLAELQNRMVSNTDLEQFLESVLASVCDKFQVDTAFIASIGDDGIQSLLQVGDEELLKEQSFSDDMLQRAEVSQQKGKLKIFAWGEFWLYPLYSSLDAEEQNPPLIGILGVLKQQEQDIEDGLGEALTILGERAILALEDWRLQKQIFQAIETLSPKVEYFQRLRAATRFDQQEMLTESSLALESQDYAQWVRDALNHYWGGPKLTESPLLRLQIVQRTLDEYDGNPVNALRSILRDAIDQVKPPGERRFTAEWILYNILEMKFVEGRKVREIALRLAMSEADLYRKQRIAIDEVAKTIGDMEAMARAKNT